MTAAQEAILEQIIEAFQNGKRLSDLPDVSGTNPFNLICEVLEDGESKKAALATLLPYMEEECSYGIEFDTAVLLACLHPYTAISPCTRACRSTTG